MQNRLLLAGFSLGVVLAVSGCPVTDDYYIESANSAAKAGKAAGGSGGSAQGGVSAQPSGGKAAGGEASTGLAGAAGGDAECVPETERCNGHDDDCDGLSDDGACGTQGTFGCFGFTLGDRPDHGYMLCSGSNKRDWTNAEEACAAQDMRLAWVETEAENVDISAKITAVGNVTEVLLGGTDQTEEGDWYWSGGDLFWKGDAEGYAVDDAFEAWAATVPNNMNNEDCLVLVPSTKAWGDRTCTASYAYLCEEHEPAE